MIRTGRNWCDLLSVDKRLPELLQYQCARLESESESESGKNIELIAEVNRSVQGLAEIQESLKHMAG
ncbi:MAG: hypothetical protein CMQ34_07475 [Gammaproteobacteria bacterium]|nr:hypothetical protein [Gammaproteobacteria bacterium]